MKLGGGRKHRLRSVALRAKIREKCFDWTFQTSLYTFWFRTVGPHRRGVGFKWLTDVLKGNESRNKLFSDTNVCLHGRDVAACVQIIRPVTHTSTISKHCDSFLPQSLRYLHLISRVSAMESPNWAICCSHWPPLQGFLNSWNHLPIGTRSNNEDSK